jgi:hypothetical protein
MCVSGAVKAPIDKRFNGLKARALVALLIYLGPLLRGWERMKWRIRETRAQPHAAPAETEQRSRIWWRQRAFDLAFWNETGTEKEALLGSLMQFLTPQKYFVVPDAGWSGWDLKIARGLCSRALVLVCTENHGGAKRLLRVRCTMRLSRPALFLLRGYGLLTALALLLGWPIAAAVLATAGFVNLAAMGTNLAVFARLMHRIIETVAKPAGLTPVEPRPDASRAQVASEPA